MNDDRRAARRWMARNEIAIVVLSAIMGAEDSRWANVVVRWSA